MEIALFNLMSQNCADETPAEILRTTVDKVRLAELVRRAPFSSHSVTPGR